MVKAKHIRSLKQTPHKQRETGREDEQGGKRGLVFSEFWSTLSAAAGIDEIPLLLSATTTALR